jgi:DNA adenine methylase
MYFKLIYYLPLNHERIHLNMPRSETAKSHIFKNPTSRRSSTQKNDLLRPFLKWAGGKRQLLPILRTYIPKNFGSSTYFEPFVGAGAFLFDFQPRKAVINDANDELINCYRTIKENPDELLSLTKKYQQDISKERYLELRKLDRNSSFSKLSNVERAARIIYLNKTCFNGLFRVNSQGQFNVPYGDNKNPILADEVIIRAIHRYLNENNIEIVNLDFEKSVVNSKKGDFIYFDPPYDPLSNSSSFTGYDLNGFGKDEQRRLKNVCDKLVKKGCKVLVSNSSTDFIKELYGENYSILEVEASRHINSVGSGRGKINELLIFSNYDVN